MPRPLAIVETHPIQYRAPVYRALRQKFGIPVKVIYGSDFSVAGYYDPEFRSQFAWDTDLLSGYDHTFLSTVAKGGGRNYDSVSTSGLASALAALNPGAVLLPGYSPRFHQWAWFHAWRAGKPILFRGETADRPQSSGAVTVRARNFLLDTLYRRCAKLLYIGSRSRAHYVSHGCPDEKLVFSPYCVDNGPFQPGEDARAALRAPLRRELGIAEGDTVVLFSGKLSERKGPDLLVEAVRALPAARRARTVILFLGDGELKATLQAAADREPAVRILLPGFRNQKELSPFFHAADMLVLPSRRLETWGLVVNEALQHGLPCIVSDAVGCGPDLVIPGLTGEVFTTGSADSLQAAIVKVSALTGHLATRAACREKIAGYSVDKAAEGIARAWEATV